MFERRFVSVGKWFVLATAAMSSFACGGVGDDADDEEVGASADDLRGGNSGGPMSIVALERLESGRRAQFCSGTLITARHLLTSAKCVKAGSTYRAYFGHDVSWGSGTWVGAQRAEVGGASGLAILTLPPSGAANVAPHAVVDRALTQAETQTFVAGRVTIMGFGADSAGGTPGRKRVGRGKVEYLGTTRFGTRMGTTMLDYPRASVCDGDIGGPAIMYIGGVPRVIGVAQNKSPDCAGESTFARVDIDLAFIKRATASY